MMRFVLAAVLSCTVAAASLCDQLQCDRTTQACEIDSASLIAACVITEGSPCDPNRPTLACAEGTACKIDPSTGNTGLCTSTDPCSNTQCSPGEECTIVLGNATCTVSVIPHGSPCGVSLGQCEAGTSCTDGTCQGVATDPCTTVICPAAERCEGTQGNTTCTVIILREGEQCSDTRGTDLGECIMGTECSPTTMFNPTCQRVSTDPCDTITCLEGELCEAGQCLPISLDEGDQCRSTANITLGECVSGTACTASGGGSAVCLSSTDPCYMVQCAANEECIGTSGTGTCTMRSLQVGDSCVDGTGNTLGTCPQNTECSLATDSGRGGVCQDPCSGVVCSGSEMCVAQGGTSVCEVIQLGKGDACLDAQQVKLGECSGGTVCTVNPGAVPHTCQEADPCEMLTCGVGEECVEVATGGRECVKIILVEGQSCSNDDGGVRGMCVQGTTCLEEAGETRCRGPTTGPCAGVSCADGEVCDPATTGCVAVALSEGDECMVRNVTIGTCPVGAECLVSQNGQRFICTVVVDCTKGGLSKEDKTTCCQDKGVWCDEGKQVDEVENDKAAAEGDKAAGLVMREFRLKVKGDGGVVITQDPKSVLKRVRWSLLKASINTPPAYLVVTALGVLDEALEPRKDDTIYIPRSWNTDLLPSEETTTRAAYSAGILQEIETNVYFDFFVLSSNVAQATSHGETIKQSVDNGSLAAPPVTGYPLIPIGGGVSPRNVPSGSGGDLTWLGVVIGCLCGVGLVGGVVFYYYRRKETTKTSFMEVDDSGYREFEAMASGEHVAV